MVPKVFRTYSIRPLYSLTVEEDSFEGSALADEAALAVKQDPWKAVAINGRSREPDGQTSSFARKSEFSMEGYEHASEGEKLRDLLDLQLAMLLAADNLSPDDFTARLFALELRRDSLVRKYGNEVINGSGGCWSSTHNKEKVVLKFDARQGEK